MATSDFPSVYEDGVQSDVRRGTIVDHVPPRQTKTNPFRLSCANTIQSVQCNHRPVTLQIKHLASVDVRFGVEILVKNQVRSSPPPPGDQSGLAVFRFTVLGKQLTRRGDVTPFQKIRVLNEAYTR